MSDTLAAAVRAALDEFGAAFEESMSFDYERGSEEEARRDARMKAAIKVLSPHQMQQWLAALLAERDQYAAVVDAARAFMVADNDPEYKRTLWFDGFTMDDTTPGGRAAQARWDAYEALQAAIAAASAADAGEGGT